MLSRWFQSVAQPRGGAGIIVMQGTPGGEVFLRFILWYIESRLGNSIYHKSEFEKVAYYRCLTY